MPHSDFVEMWLYEQMEPFGEKGDYLRAGIQTSVLANIHRDPKKSKRFDPDDFIPDVDRARREAFTMHARFAAFAAAHNAKVAQQGNA